jgi:hypothetical protein
MLALNLARGVGLAVLHFIALGRLQGVCLHHHGHRVRVRAGRKYGTFRVGYRPTGLMTSRSGIENISPKLVFHHLEGRHLELA